MKDLTTTSYAILGLLAVQPWTTYELAKQMEVSLHNFWPRAERKLYEEPRKLVAHGLAEMSREKVGRRPRTVYRITPDGRQALADWLDRPGAMPSLEFEALVKVFFAEQGTAGQLLATLEHIRQSAVRRQSVDARWAAHYLATGGRFPERLPVIILVGKLQAELNRTLSSWAEWACDAVTGWPPDPCAAPPDLAALEEIAGDLDEGDATLPPPGYEGGGS